MAKIKINEDLCIGCGACASAAPELFVMNSNMKSESKKQEVKNKEEKEAKNAAEICPVNAIKVE